MLEPSRNGAARAVALACALVGACRSEAAQPVEPAQKSELLVLAATSLTDAFQQIERDYERAHPEVDVLLSLAGSSALALQVDRGGSGDVLATANEEHLRALVASGLIEADAVFAHNELVLAVAPGNPAEIARFEDLPKAQRVVLGAANVPVGQYADALLDRASATLGASFGQAVRGHVVSREANVRLVLAKVELGEADAAIVYRSDIRDPACKPAPAGAPAFAAGCRKAQALAIPSELAGRATYPIGVATRSKHPALARTFVEHVLSPQGQAALSDHGFIAARPHVAAAQPASAEPK